MSNRTFAVFHRRPAVYVVGFVVFVALAGLTYQLRTFTAVERYVVGSLALGYLALAYSLARYVVINAECIRVKDVWGQDEMTVHWGFVVSVQRVGDEKLVLLMVDESVQSIPLRPLTRRNREKLVDLIQQCVSHG